MRKAKMTAKQKQEQAAKQKKMELMIISIVAAVLIVAVVLIVVFVGNGEQIAHTHDENCNHGTEPVTTTAHQHDENCSHEEVTTPPVSRENGGDGATLETAAATHYVTIEIENYGTLKGELYGNTAPISVNNFVSLAQSGFYDGLTFHRIIEGFMMQGGAPNADSPSVETIRGEFAANGIENNLLHEPGVLSMARTNVMDSATSQFFVMH